jgi:diguanylate cyclase (GGDEF)-like protein/PAS domain S-box-containing protein
MTSPLAGDPGAASGTEPTAAERRRKLVRKWSHQVSLTSYIPLPHAEIEQELLALTNLIFNAITAEPMPTDQIAEVGARLIELHCVGKASLQCTIDVLAAGLLAEPELRRLDRLPERVAHLIGALASGYAEAIRSSTMDQQDNLHRALLEAVWIAERRVKTSESRLDEVISRSPDGIAITDLEGRFVRVNGEFDRILDRETADSTLFDLVRPLDSIDLRGAYLGLLHGGVDRLALRPSLVRRDGATMPVSLTASLLPDADGNASTYVTVVVDDSEIATLRAEVDHQERHDVVTGLPNRTYFSSHLAHVLDASGPTTLYELELDGFAQLTDGLGRWVGDTVLRVVAERLLAVVSDAGSTMVARFDGATFAILVENSPVAPDTVTMIKTIRQALAEPVLVAELWMHASVSIGVVHQFARACDPAELIRAADLALRRAKSKGCGQWALFDPDRDNRAMEAGGLAATMSRAWDSGALRVVYRPVLRLADEQVVGIEAMLRWDHPEHGSIPHRRCLELAEDIGLILPLGNLVLHRACELLRRRRGVRMHLDFTPNQAGDRDLVRNVTQTLEDSKIGATRLQLGLPSAALRGPRGAADNLVALAGTGVTIAVHHFAGAPEDLAQLEDLPIDVVRVAPALVRRLAQQPGQDSLVARSATHLMALVHLAKATVTVDDLQTRTQAIWWHMAGADTATGPVFTRDAG